MPKISVKNKAEKVKQVYEVIVELGATHGHQRVTYAMVQEELKNRGTSVGRSTISEYITQGFTPQTGEVSELFKGDDRLAVAWFGTFNKYMVHRLNLNSESAFVDSWVLSLDDPYCSNLISILLKFSTAKSAELTKRLEKMSEQLALCLGSNKLADNALDRAIGASVRYFVKNGVTTKIGLAKKSAHKPKE